MASNIKGLTIELNGDTTGFKAALNSADKSLRATQSELRAVKEGLKLEWDSAKFSKAQDLAKKAVVETNQKVEILRKGLVELEKQGLDNTNDDFRKLTKEITYAENAAKRAQNELSAINKLKFDNTEKQLKSMDNTLNTVAKGAAVVGAAFIASGTAAVKLGLDAIKNADDIATTATQLGITTEQLQKYQYLAMQTDVSNESLSKAFVKLNADVGNLALGIEDNGNKALVKLIGSVKNADGSLKDSEQVFYEVITALQSMNSEQERSGYLAQIFGEKMGKDLNPMLNMTVDELKALEDEFYNVGYLTDENVSKLADMDNTLNEMRSIIKQVGLEAGVELLPVFEEFANLVRENKDEIKSFAVDTIRNITGVIKTVYEMRGAIAAAAAVFGVLKAAVTIASVIIAAQKAMEGYTIATKGAELANKALAVSTALTPWGVIAVALSAVVAGLLAYNLATGGAKTETDKLNDSIKQIKESYDSAVESIDDRTTSQQAELDIASRLIDKYDDLNSKVNKTATEKAELTKIVEQINAILPDAIGKINEETGAYLTQTEALRQLVEQKRLNVREAAVMAKATETQSTILENEDALSQAESRFRSLGKGVSYAEIEKITTAILGSDRDRERSFVAAKYGLSAKEVKELEKSYRQIIDLKDEIARLNKKVNDLLNSSTTMPDNDTTDLGEPPAPYAIIETDDTRKKYDEIQKRKGLELAAGLLTEQQYYDALESAQGEYLTEYSDAWLKAEAEINNGRKRLREIAEKELEDARKKEQQAKEKSDAETAKKAEEERKAAEKKAEDARKTEEKAAEDKAKAEEEEAQRAKQKAEDDAQALVDEYEGKKDDLEYYLELDMITEAEYYVELAKLRDTYLEENSAEWRRITIAIYNFKREAEEAELAAQKKAMEDDLKAQEESAAAVQKQIEDTYNKQIKAIEDALAEKKKLYEEETKSIEAALKEQQDAYKAEYEAKSKQIDRELELERKRINTIIDAIDKEVAARQRLRETESADDKVTAAQKALEAAQIELDYARTEYEKAELAKEVQRRQKELDVALQDREDTLFYQQKQVEKDAAQAELDAKTAAANEQKDAAQATMENLSSQAATTAKAQTDKIKAELTVAEQQAESARVAADAKRTSDKAALGELENATNYTGKDYIFMTDEERALQDMVNSVYKSAIATAQSVDDVKRATETINSIVNNNTKNANVTVNTTNGISSGQVKLTVEKLLNEY